MKHIFIFLYLFVNVCYLTAEDVFERLTAVENETISGSFDFHQLIEFDLQNYRQRNEGNLIFQKPRHFRIELKKPYRQITMSDGKKFYNYNSQTNQVIISDLEKIKKTGMLYGWPENFAGNFAELKKKYEMRLVENTTAHILISLEDKKADFTMNFFFEPENLTIKKTEFMTKGTKITTEVYNYQKNPTIKKDTFKFVPPRGAEIIK